MSFKLANINVPRDASPEIILNLLNLNDDADTKISEYLENPCVISNASSFLKQVLNTDLCLISNGTMLTELRLSENTLKDKICRKQINSVFQILQCMNISVPKSEIAEFDDEETSFEHSSQMYKLLLTDGVHRCYGTNVTPINGINDKTLMGSKIYVNGMVDVSIGIMLLTQNTTFMLGGSLYRYKPKVDKIEKTPNAPKFVPFTTEK
ncbi:hypothetical protein A3Q56_02471 [Intoshia linei]|uniref:RecQ-mediated genome instability protein 1 n=1 Tax=Intoshia linei TaxID=1819745 RepID=A0A177B7V7_9BILA|nr:hypothetical protein A3Q56_02471 [Intoshia linei]